MYNCRLFLLLLFVIPGFQTQCRPLQYTISPVFMPQTTVLRALRIQLVLTGDADGETILELPGQFGEADHLYRAVRKLRYLHAQRMRIDADSLFIVLEHAPGEPNLTLTYEIVQTFPGNTVGLQSACRAIVQPDYFHILGIAMFILPATQDGYDVQVTWEGFPDNWLIHNSFASNIKSQKWQFSDAVWLESVFIGGNFRLLKTDVAAQPVYLALRGTDWNFTDAALLDLLRQTILCQRIFWRDTLIPYYTVTLLPLAVPPVLAGGGSGNYEYMGIGLQNSFAAFATPGRGMQLSDFQHLFHHELMHNWIGGKIRNGGTANDMQFAWWSEGFTEYLSWLNQRKSGLISDAAWITAVNERFITPLYSSPVAEAPNSTLTRDFFNLPEIRELAYNRGFVLALCIDFHIQKRTKGQQSINDLMQQLLVYYQHDKRNLLLDFAYFENQLSLISGINAHTWLQKHVEKGHLLQQTDFVNPPIGYTIIWKNGRPLLEKQ